MSRLTGDSPKQEHPGAVSSAPPTDATSNMSVSTKLFRRGVYESYSGVRFLSDRNTITAQLGSKLITLQGLDPLLLNQARATGSFPPEMVKAFADQVIPQLIEPVRHQIIEEIRRFNEAGAVKDSSIKTATIDSVDPLEFTIKGVLYSGHYYERTGSFTWNPAGNLTVMTDGKCHRVPVSKILGGQQGFLSKVLTALGSLS